MENNLLNFIDDNTSEKQSAKLLQLETQVKKLANENMSLKAKVNNLEILVERICTQMNIKSPDIPPIKTLSEDNEEETWLYYVQKGVSKDKIINQLNYKQDDYGVIEIKVDSWVNEKQMYIDILSKFEKFKEFIEDWNGMSQSQLDHYLKTILSSSLISDVVIILRGLPGKTNKNYENIMSQIASLAGLMFNTWEEMEVNSDLMGKMALVLESEEELQILNILKNNSRLILFVDNLFKSN
jgi:hypothetical protein